MGANGEIVDINFSRATTATYVDRNGIIREAASNVPRFDFSDNPEGALLLEPQRTNLIEQSEYFGGSYYGKGSGVSVVDNNYTSPEGVLNGAKLTGAIGTTRGGEVITRVMSVSSIYYLHPLLFMCIKIPLLNAHFISVIVLLV